MPNDRNRPVSKNVRPIRGEPPADGSTGAIDRVAHRVPEVERPVLHYRVGDPVVHPEHGDATVTFIGSEYAGLRFRDGRDALFRIEELDPGGGQDGAVEPDPESEPLDDVAPDASPSWPDSTFLAAVDDQRHIPGMHWMPFSEEGVDPFFERLAELCSQSSLLPAYGIRYRAHRTAPGDWPEGFCIVRPEGGERPGVLMTMVVTERGNEFVSFNPRAIGRGDAYGATSSGARVGRWPRGAD